jgi:hypothetical protein
VPLALVVGRNRLSPVHRKRLGTRTVFEATDAAEFVAAGQAIGRMFSGGPQENRTLSPSIKEKQ